jgi:aminoglycoside phosphotransferase (APT) family kinase protein
VSASGSLGLSQEAEKWLSANVEGYRGPGRLRKFGFGQSNPTFRLDGDGCTFVVRRKPLGDLLPGAHAIEREFRVMKSLAGTDVPTPRMHALCTDAAILGAPFYVMEFVDGRIFYDQRMPGLSARHRAALFDSMNETVARLHQVQPATIGLEGFGKPFGFMSRQIATWSRQYRAAEDQRIESMEELIRWLPTQLPPDVDAAIFHGDLRLDNMIFHARENRVVALLDWELSTLGDPLADFAYHAMAWRIDSDVFRGLRDLDRPALGIPDEQEYIELYEKRSGRRFGKYLDFYLSFAVFRVAAILQGVAQRAKMGNASAENAAALGAMARPLADVGWKIARGAGG